VFGWCGFCERQGGIRVLSRKPKLDQEKKGIRERGKAGKVEEDGERGPGPLTTTWVESDKVKTLPG
jgi:hypothetical protein